MGILTEPQALCPVRAEFLTSPENAEEYEFQFPTENEEEYEFLFPTGDEEEDEFLTSYKG